MADFVRVALYGVLPSFAAALLLVGAFGTRLLGLAAGLGLFTALALLRGRMPPWPHDLWSGSNDGIVWLCWSAVAIGVVAATDNPRVPRWLTVPGGVAVLAAELWLLLTTRRARLATTESLAVHGCAAVGAVAIWFAVRRAIAQRGGATIAWMLTACLVGDSIVLVLSGSALQGQLAGAVAAAFGTAAATALWRRPLRLEVASALPFAALHTGLLVAGNQLSELEPVPALLAGLAPTALAFAGHGGKGMAGNARLLLAMTATSLLIAAAIGLVLRSQV